jgi:uncharacterized protein
MPVPARTNFVTLAAKDLPALRRFYQALGWPESGVSSDEFAVFQTAGAVLALWGVDNLAHDAGPAAAKGPGGFCLSINVDRREQVDEVLAEVDRHGATVVTPGTDMDWGGRSGNFTDPEGNPWEVAWNPHTSFDERGGLIFP